LSITFSEVVVVGWIEERNPTHDNCYDFLEQLEKSIFYVQQHHHISEEIGTRQGAV
jgi:hypothetical protein